MENSVMYQVSTLQALSLGYARPVVRVSELLMHGDTGLGTFEDVGGEMIALDGRCWQAGADGSAREAEADTGVPFAAIAPLTGRRRFSLPAFSDIASLKMELDRRIEEDFGLNSMHIVRIDGSFEKVWARSESPLHTQHVTLKEMLAETQRDFSFENIDGTLVCVYFPDYMDGINAPGWHLHFLSEDRTAGGHVFELKMKQGEVLLDKLSRIEIQLPREAAFDTYALKEASHDEIRQVEQGKG